MKLQAIKKERGEKLLHAKCTRRLISNRNLMNKLFNNLK